MLTTFVRGLPAVTLAITLTTGAAMAQAPPSTAPTPSPSPSSAMDPKIAALAKQWLLAVQSGHIDRSQLAPQTSAAFTPGLLEQVSAQLAPLGAPVGFTLIDAKQLQGITVYHFRATFASGRLDEFIGLDPNGQILQINFTPEM